MYDEIEVIYYDMNSIHRHPVECFLERYGNQIKLEFSPEKANPYFPREGCTHWKCTLSFEEGAECREMEMILSMGFNLRELPSLSLVLKAITNDYYFFNSYPDFREWVYELGGDISEPEDEAKYKKMYEANKEQNNDFDRLLGDDLVQEIIYGNDEEDGNNT